LYFSQVGHLGRENGERRSRNGKPFAHVSG
jgi:hypothetical protein